MGTETCKPKRPVPVIHFHGTDDEFAPFKGGTGAKSLSGNRFLLRRAFDPGMGEGQRLQGGAGDQTAPGEGGRRHESGAKTYGGGKDGGLPADCPHSSHFHCSARFGQNIAPRVVRGYTDIPAYSQVLQLPRSTDSYGRRLPGLSFAASGQALTTPRNLPAPGRRQPLYVVLRLSRDLCFW